MAAKNRCTGCKKYFPKDELIIVTAGKFHSQECLKDYGMKSTQKIVNIARKQKQKKEKLEATIFKINDVSKQHELTQAVFNKMRRLEELYWFKVRGLEPECISCGKKNMDWCCGHFKCVKTQGAIRYDRVNTYLQCNRYCNRALSGNIEGNKNTRGYKQGLKDRFGIERYNEITAYCEKDRIKKWTGRELYDMRKEFNKEIRELEEKLSA